MADPRPVVCTSCGRDFEAAPKSSPGGLKQFSCTHCKAKVFHPLAPWLRTLFLVLLAPGLALVGWVGYTITHRPLALGDTGRLLSLLWALPLTVLCRDRYARNRLDAVMSRATPEERGLVAKNLGAWKSSPEFAIMWAGLIVTLVPLYYLRFATTAKIRAFGDQAAHGFRTGDYKSAEAAIDGLIALGLADKSPDLLAQRAYARALAGKIEPALSDADAALKRQPDLVIASVARCVAFEGSKDWGKALTECAAAQAKVPAEKGGLLLVVRSRLASAKFSTGDYLGAQAEYTAVLALSSTTAPAYLNRAMVAVMIGPKEQGQADLRRALELAPSLKPDRLGPVGMLNNDNFEPLISLGLRRGREALATLAGLELAKYQAARKFDFSVEELIADNPAADAVRSQLKTAFDGGAVSFSTSTPDLAITGIVKGSKRQVEVRGDAKGFVLPELKWENGTFAEQRIEPPKPKIKPKAKKRATRKR